MAENGPWSSANTQLFIGPLIDNLIAVLQADWVEGLENPVHSEVNGGEPMTPYQNWHQSVFVPVIEDDSQPYPACSVIPHRSKTRKGDGGPILDEDHIIEILIETIGPDPDLLAKSVLKRVQAAHIIIERASTSALFDGFLDSKRHLPHWDIDHDYRAFRHRTKSTYKQDGSLIITFTGLMEKT
jgi:hypothetical protein